MKTMLVTGFEPFDRDTVNPSGEVLPHLRAPEGFTLVTKLLPVSFAPVDKEYPDLLFSLKPDVILNLGLANGRDAVTPEMAAVNLDSTLAADGSSRLTDNLGETRSDTPIDPAGPAAYFAAAPVRALVSAIKASGVSAKVSFTAGTFLCNHVMYLSLRYAEQEDRGVLADFIHLPCLPVQAEKKGDGKPSPSMELEEMVTAVQAAMGFLASVSE